MICFKKHDATIEDLRQKLADTTLALAVAKTKLELLEPEVVKLEAENRMLTDRVIAVGGFKPMYEKVHELTPEEQEPVKPITNIRDYVNAAQAEEDKAFRESRLEDGRRALKEANLGGTNAATDQR